MTRRLSDDERESALLDDGEERAERRQRRGPREEMDAGTRWERCVWNAGGDEEIEDDE
jgi:hypothetical protein